MPKTKELSQDIRKLIVSLHSKGLGYRKISSQVNIPISTVGDTIRRFKSHRSVKSLPRSGHPSKISICGKRFSRQKNLTTPTKIHTGDKPFECKTCGKVFSWKHRLQDHMRIHTGEKPDQNTGTITTPKTKELSQDIRELIISLHSKGLGYRKISSQVNIPVSTVGDTIRRFNSHHTVKSLPRSGHPSKNTGEKSFRCKTCDKVFSRKSVLITHVRIHTGEKPFHCETCGKDFPQKHHLLGHIRMHTGEKPFQCGICSKEFFRKDHLQEHMRVHTGEKLFHCETCGKGFSRKGYLTTHMRIHTAGESFALWEIFV